MPEASHKDSRKRHAKPIRQKWFGCACCPPNLARLISSIGEYCFTENESTLFIHQYIGCEAQAENAKIKITSTYTENGEVEIEITPRRNFTLAIRIPDWCNSYSFSLPCEIKNGYSYFEISDKTTLKASFEMRAKLIKCSNLVRENAGKVAVMRGPFVYCAEEADNGKNLQMLRIAKNTAFVYDESAIVADGFREEENLSLYSEWSDPKETAVKIKLIPYYQWGNRGENEMSVYIRI